MIIMVNGIYAGSFDPLTNGHLNILERSSQYFDKLYCGIANNSEKKYTFSVDERVDMARHVTKKMGNVEVVLVEGNLPRFAYEHNIHTVVRGVRDVNDLSEEIRLQKNYKEEYDGLDFMMITADPKLDHVSSSSVKAVLAVQGSIETKVPMYVKQRLEEKLMGQYIVGVTGEPGSGKSYITNKFVELGMAQGILVHDIDLDAITHDIYKNRTEPVYKYVRESIGKSFDLDLKSPDYFIDIGARKKIGEIVFENPIELGKLNDFMKTPLITRMREEMVGKKGLVLMNAALIVESNMGYLVNNNVLMVDVEKCVQRKRLTKRGLNDDQINRRLNSQFSYQLKKDYFCHRIDIDNCGHVIEFNNSFFGNDEGIEEIFKQVILQIGVK